jgi:hypothetical protein
MNFSVLNGLGVGLGCVGVRVPIRWVVVEFHMVG